MPEKLFTMLLSLYPVRFRETYGDEALQLIRERARSETGFVRRLRLCFDLLSDLAVSRARGYPLTEAGLAGARAATDGIPSFQLLAEETPRRGAFMFGCLLSLAMVVAFPASIRDYLSRGPSDASTLDPLRAVLARVRQSSGQPPANPAVIEDQERRRVIDAAIAKLQEHYFDPNVARQVAGAIQTKANSGDYDAITEGAVLAERLTRHMREASHDSHLELVFSRNPLPDRQANAGSEDAARYRAAMQQSNCTFETAEMLPHNTGYLKFNSFPERSVCEQVAASSMKSLNGADAVIFDLRDNRGGYPDMVKFMASYLFDHPEYLYNPRENTTRESWTQSPVPGNHLADKPVYVLISGRTASGAEHFSYDLKMLKRATLVGETTRGAAHSGVFYRLDDHFGIGIPEVRPINPFSDRDWEGTGVEPDVKVNAADALATALKLAGSASRK